MSKFKSKDFEQRVSIACAHEGCSEPAMVSNKLKTGWATLCKNHYMFHTQREANDFCKANDLLTRERQVDFIRAKMKNSKLLGRVIRVPGQEG